MNTAKGYVEEKFHGSRGHGFAAESANDLYDRMHGKNAKIVGGDNAKDGADRIVNGTNIQSKYCSSGSKCIQECFRKSLLLGYAYKLFLDAGLFQKIIFAVQKL